MSSSQTVSLTAETADGAMRTFLMTSGVTWPRPNISSRNGEKSQESMETVAKYDRNCWNVAPASSWRTARAEGDRARVRRTCDCTGCDATSQVCRGCHAGERGAADGTDTDVTSGFCVVRDDRDGAPAPVRRADDSSSSALS